MMMKKNYFKIAIPLLFVGMGLIYAFSLAALKTSNLAEKESLQTAVPAQFPQTAVPTVFSSSSKIPEVELVWVRADSKLVEIAFKIDGLDLEPGIDPTDWICSPVIQIGGPTQHRFEGYSFASSAHQPDGSFQPTYRYEIDANGANSLDISLDLTIGPCADYLNFQETNVTPSPLPELVGNYHFDFRVPVQ